MADSDKRLSTFDATLLVMGGILGVGIFFTPQLVAERTHDEWAFLGMWLIGGFFALAAAMTFAEWGATLPEAGGWYVFLRESLGKLPAFLFAWSVLFVVSTGAIASVAKFAATSLDAAFPSIEFGDGGQLATAAILVTAVTGACLTGVKASAVFQNVIMVIKLTAIAALIIAGWLFFDPGTALDTMVPEPDALVPPPDAGATASDESILSGMLGALLPVFYAYGGWQMVCYIAPQVRDPARTLPRAILLGVVGVIIVYVLLASSYLRVLGIDSIAADKGFATDIGERVFGTHGTLVFNLGFAVSATGWLVVTILGTPWLYVAMARERLFFASFERRSSRDAPTRALILQWAISMLYLVAADLNFLVDAVVFSEWIFHGLVAYGLMRFRRLRPDAKRPFRSPLYPLAPVCYLIAAILAVGNTILSAEDPKTPMLGGVILGCGALAYFGWTRFQNQHPD